MPPPSLPARPRPRLSRRSPRPPAVPRIQSPKLLPTCTPPHGADRPSHRMVNGRKISSRRSSAVNGLVSPNRSRLRCPPSPSSPLCCSCSSLLRFAAAAAVLPRCRRSLARELAAKALSSGRLLRMNAVRRERRCRSVVSYHSGMSGARRVPASQATRAHRNASDHTCCAHRECRKSAFVISICDLPRSSAP